MSIGLPSNTPVQLASGTPAPVHGANVIAPLEGLTVHTPTPGSTKLVTGTPGFAGSIIITVVGSTRSPSTSFANTSITASMPGITSVISSTVATGT